MPRRASTAPSTRRRSAWRSSISTASGGRSTGRCARCCATRRQSCSCSTREELTHPDDLAADLAQVAGFVSGRDRPQRLREALHRRARRHRLDAGVALARPRRRGEPALLHRPDPGHHRAPAVRGQALAPGRPRLLTGLFNRRRFEQELDAPGGVHRALRHPGHGADARPRQLQVRQRHARARDGRRAAGPRLHGAGRAPARDRHHRPPRRRRVRDHPARDRRRRGRAASPASCSRRSSTTASSCTRAARSR